jgi:hypothetical protein
MRCMGRVRELLCRETHRQAGPTASRHRPDATLSGLLSAVRKKKTAGIGRRPWAINAIVGERGGDRQSSAARIKLRSSALQHLTSRDSRSCKPHQSSDDSADYGSLCTKYELLLGGHSIFQRPMRVQSVSVRLFVPQQPCSFVELPASTVD